MKDTWLFVADNSSTTMTQMSRLFVPHITSRLGAVPWAIVYDAEFDSVLITIRGSKSVSDVLTDLMRTYDHP